jgi:hypothetical protein
MEPITTIKMDPKWWRHLEKHGRVFFNVIEPISWESVVQNHANIQLKYHRCEVLGHVISNTQLRSKYILMTTNDEVEALLMEPEFMPGQRRMLNAEKLKSFVRGLTLALQGLE